MPFSPFWLGPTSKTLKLALTFKTTLNLALEPKRFAIQSEELLWRSQFKMDFIETWQTCVKNCFLLTALLSSHLQSVLQGFIQVLKRKNDKKRQKVLE